MEDSRPHNRVLKAQAVGKTEVATVGHIPLKGLGALAVAASAAAAVTGAMGKTIEDVGVAMGKLPDKTQPPPQEADVNTPFAAMIGVKLDGEVRPGDVLAYNVAEGWIECGRYITINGERRWKRERGRILSYRKTGVVEPYWR